ncbi:MAG TPA: hypothetical protein VNG33_03460, partial [Polyangiaceae bacterium]|nr:hypothetical protein [Polyangiaceae bacterium]
MSNLKLVPDQPTPLEKLLLDASRAETPSEDHKAKLRAVLGIGLTLSGPVSVPPAAGAVSGTQVGAGGAAPSAAGGAAAATKSTTFAKAAFGVAAVALVGAFMLLQKPAAQAPSAPVGPAPVRVAATAPVAAAAPVAGSIEAAPAVSPLPPVEESPAAAPRVARTEASSS